MTKSKAKTINSDNTAKTTKLAVTAMLAALSDSSHLHSMSSIFPKFPFLSEHSAWGRLPVQ